MSDSSKIDALQARIRELERIIGQKQIELEFKDKMIDLAEEQYQVDIKKNLGRNCQMVYLQTRPILVGQ